MHIGLYSAILLMIDKLVFAGKSMIDTFLKSHIS